VTLYRDSLANIPGQVMWCKHVQRCRPSLTTGGHLHMQGPPLLKGVFGTLRGYAGNISPAAALDAVANDGNTLLIDIRCGRPCRLWDVSSVLKLCCGWVCQNSDSQCQTSHFL
jgi:hypothetical protein